MTDVTQLSPCPGEEVADEEGPSKAVGFQTVGDVEGGEIVDVVPFGIRAGIAVDSIGETIAACYFKAEGHTVVINIFQSQAQHNNSGIARSPHVRFGGRTVLIG